MDFKSAAARAFCRSQLTVNLISREYYITCAALYGWTGATMFFKMPPQRALAYLKTAMLEKKMQKVWSRSTTFRTTTSCVMMYIL
jgi:hypothetical protein